jgi:hypothetical protein
LKNIHTLTDFVNLKYRNQHNYLTKKTVILVNGLLLHSSRLTSKRKENMKKFTVAALIALFILIFSNLLTTFSQESVTIEENTQTPPALEEIPLVATQPQPVTPGTIPVNPNPAIATPLPEGLIMEPDLVTSLMPTLVPTATVSIVPTSTVQPGLTEVINDDFESGILPSHWLRNPTYSIVSYDNRQVLQFSYVDSFAHIGFSHVSDFILETDFRLNLGSMEIRFRMSDAGNYGVVLDATDQNIHIQRGDATLAISGFLTGLSNQWHRLKLSVFGGSIEVEIDDTPAISVVDENPVPPGVIAIRAGTSEGNEFYLDNFRFLLPSTSLIEPTAAPTLGLPSIK